MIDYSFEKFGRAVHELAASKEDIKTRLSRATDHLSLVREENIPDELKEKFNTLYERITSGTPHDREGTLAATVNQITEDEAVEIAGEIVSLNDDIVLWYGKNWGKQ